MIYIYYYFFLLLFIIMNIINKPIAFVLNNIKVYEAINVYNYDPSFFLGCSRIRLIINKKKLNDEDYIFGYIKNGNWIKSKKTYSKAKLLLNATWVENNVPKLKITVQTNNNNITRKTFKIKIKKKNKTQVYNKKEDENNNTCINYDNTEVDNNLYNILPAPDILELKDDQKFKDQFGNIMDIEVRGKRNRNDCYFCVKDISNSFKINRLQNTIIRTDSEYKENIHYKYFTLIKRGNPAFLNSKKQVFITYKGLLRILFISRSGNVEHFQDWAEDILFTVQLGTTIQKNELVSKVLGVTALAVKEVFKTSVTTTPCVYLFSLNTVKELRNSMDINDSIPDNFIIAKYGMTKNLEQRTTQHLNDYGKMQNVELKLKYYTYIDTQYISDAETDMSDFFKNGDMMFNYQNRSELVVIDPNKFKKIEKQYNIIFKLYAGHIKDLMIRIKELENELLLIKVTHKNELQEEKYKNELQEEKYKNGLQEEKYKNKLLQRDLETTQQKFKIKELTFLLNQK
jgi:prophage antirepressor-like protein